MQLTVITHTKGDRPELLRRCCESVEQALPKGVTHKVVTCPTVAEWALARIRASLDHEYVAFVDDDDELEPWAISTCLEALKPDVGVVFNDDVQIRVDGTRIPHRVSPKTYDGVRNTPREIHQLAIINSKFVDPTLLGYSVSYMDFSMDWFIKASAALRGGAIHVPVPGYLWHKQTDSMSKEHSFQFFKFEPLLRAVVCTKEWGSRKGLIPQYLPKEYQHG